MHRNARPGPTNGRWNGDRLRSSHGYVLVRVGKGHPLADVRGYAYEHLLVWVAAGNPLPKADEQLHHKNECKHDNRLANLALTTKSEHASYHARRAKRRADGTFRSLAA